MGIKVKMGFRDLSENEFLGGFGPTGHDGSNIRNIMHDENYSIHPIALQSYINYLTK